MNSFFSTYQSPVGLLEIQASDQGLQTILYKDQPDPTTQINHSDAESNPLIEECKQQLTAYFEGKLRQFDLPFTLSGTSFQEQVWNQLLTVKYGSTLSYLQIAQKINRVKAIRAVGTANGQNKLSILVPCHRIIGTNGALTGYSGGLWRKKWLLEHEAKHRYGLRGMFDEI